MAVALAGDDQDGSAAHGLAGLDKPTDRALGLITRHPVQVQRAFNIQLAFAQFIAPSPVQTLQLTGLEFTAR